jgi:hypothetical protein
MAACLVSSPLTAEAATYLDKSKPGAVITGEILSVNAIGIVFKTVEGRLTIRIPYEQLEEAEIAADPKVKAFRGTQPPAANAPPASSPRLRQIIFPGADASYPGIPLEEVVIALHIFAKKHDPEKRGLAFEAARSLAETTIVTVEMKQAVSLETLLQAVVKGADTAITYRLVGEKVVFMAANAVGQTATPSAPGAPMLDKAGNPVAPGNSTVASSAAPKMIIRPAVAARPVTFRPMDSQEVTAYLTKSGQGVVATATQIGSFGEQYYGKRVLLVDCTDLRVIGPGEYLHDYHEFTISERENYKQINFSQSASDSGKPRWIYAPTAIANQIAGLKKADERFVLSATVHKRRFPYSSESPACVVTGITPMGQFKARE